MSRPSAWWLMGLLLLAGTAGAEPARVGRAGAEMRREPGFSGAVVARPKEGEALDVLEARNEWRRVRLPDGTEGFVHEMFVSAGAAATPVPAAASAPAPAQAPPAAVAPAVASAAPPPAGGADLAAIERGELKAENARLRADLGVALRRADAAEQALARLQADRTSAPPASDAQVAELRARLAAAESARDAALAHAGEVERRMAAERDRQAVPEEILQAARDEAFRQANEKCAEDMERAVEHAREEAVAHAVSPEQQQAAIDRAIAADRATQELLRAPKEREREQACEKRVAEARAEGEAKGAAEIPRLEAEHQKLFDTYVELVTTRHEEALKRERAAMQEECERQFVEERRRTDRLIRSARKESGWEDAFEEELRARLKLALEEAEARWEAKRRGELYDEQRVRQDEAARVRAACEGERLAAVQSAISSERADAESRLRREREEADLRCQLALEIVLERAAAGEDLGSIREFARRHSEGKPKTEAGGAPPADAPAAEPEKTP